MHGNYTAWNTKWLLFIAFVSGETN